MKSDNFSDEEKEAFEQELEESDSTAILLGIYGELQAIRALLEQPQDTSEAKLECATCGESFAGEKPLRAHAQRAHKAPSDMPLESIADL
jgi:hypothetical protein